MPDRTDPIAAGDEAYRLADALVALGEPKTAVDLMRRKVHAARSNLPPDSPALLRLLSQYASILESTDALAEAEYIRTEALDIVAATNATTFDALDAFLRHGMLLCKMHNYDGAIARLKEAIRRIEELEELGTLQRQIVLGQAWRSQAQALEELGEFSEASNALDVLMSIKRQIRLLVFSPAHGL